MYEYHLPGIVNFIKNGNANPANWIKFNQHVKAHDEYRKQNFANVYPEYAKVINYE